MSQLSNVMSIKYLKIFNQSRDSSSQTESSAVESEVLVLPGVERRPPLLCLLLLGAKPRQDAAYP